MYCNLLKQIILENNIMYAIISSFLSTRWRKFHWNYIQSQKFKILHPYLRLIVGVKLFA